MAEVQFPVAQHRSVQPPRQAHQARQTGFDKRRFPSEPSTRNAPSQTHYVKARVRVHEYPDGTMAVFHGPRCPVDSQTSRVTRFDATDRRPVDKWTAARSRSRYRQASHNVNELFGFSSAPYLSTAIRPRRTVGGRFSAEQRSAGLSAVPSFAGLFWLSIPE